MEVTLSRSTTRRLPEGQGVDALQLEINSPTEDFVSVPCRTHLSSKALSTTVILNIFSVPSLERPPVPDGDSSDPFCCFDSTYYL